VSIRWEWEDGHGPGHMRRVAGDGAYTLVQRAHRAYVEHRAACGACPEECPEAERLWQAYREANGGAR
jgi:hypothetical protein